MGLFEERLQGRSLADFTNNELRIALNTALYTNTADMWSRYLQQQGYSGSVGDMMAKWWSDYSVPESFRNYITAGMALPAHIINDDGVLAPYVTFTRSSTATYYGSDGLLKTAAANEPRYDYDPVTLQLRGLLIEEQRTNFYNASNSFTAGAGTTITAAAATAPDGTTTASRYAKTDATTPRYSNSQTTMTVAANKAYTVSRYFKYDGFDTMVSLEYNSTDNWGAVAWVAFFNVTSSGVSVSSQAACTASVENVGNGWYRARATFTTGATIATPTNPQTLVRITGASGVSVLMSYAQIEQGAFATSYIPTTTAAVTRASDTAEITNLASIGFNATEGSVFAEIEAGRPHDAAAINFMKSGSASGVASIKALYLSPTYSSPAMVYDGALVGIGVDSGFTPAQGVMFKGAVAWKANDMAGVFNTRPVVSDATLTIPAGLTNATIGNQDGARTNGHIRRLRYYNRRLSNAELVSLTA